MALQTKIKIGNPSMDVHSQTGTKKSGTKKSGAKKTGTKKTGTKKSGAKKTGTKKSDQDAARAYITEMLVELSSIAKMTNNNDLHVLLKLASQSGRNAMG